MTTPQPPLLVQVQPAPGVDDEALEDLAGLLREDLLLALDVNAVDPVTAAGAPEQSKGALAVVAGWLSVNLGREALRAVVSRIGAWAAQSHSTVEVSLGGDVLKLTGASRDQQNRVIDEWLRRQTPAP